ncbi:alpha-helical coiled-coil protein [Staphylococcus aureus]|nr:alpha-helical coiled-coil protein [Staphylococcus aureus]
MTLFLLEANNLDFASTKEELEAKASSLSTKTIPTLIEAEAKQFLTEAGISIQLVKEVRLVGKDLDEVKNGDAHVDYLVTWNIPEGITMDQYLARKKKNSVHYEEVPEVEFKRTYVCEDMSKCICLYNAPDEEAVRRARKAVDTPIDGIEKL